MPINKKNTNESTICYISRKRLSNIIQNTPNIWAGPPLSPFPLSLKSNSGSPTILPDGYYPQKSSVVLNESTGDSVKSAEIFDIVNNCLYFQCILPELSGMNLGNSLYITGFSWYVQLLPKNNLIFWNDDAEHASSIFSYNPGDLLYQYYDGYNINFGFVNQNDNTFQSFATPLCLDLDVPPERLYLGFDHSIEGSTFSVTLENIQARYEGPNFTCYGNFDFTGFSNNITLPNSHTINLTCDGNSVITGFTNGFLVEPGGVGLNRDARMENSKADATWLIKKYPHLVRLNPKREGEILLISSHPQKKKKSLKKSI